MNGMRRREFVQLTAGGLAAALAGGCASFVATPVTPVNGRVLLSVRNFPALDRPGGQLRILPSGGPGPLFVLAEDDGFTVLSPICTHLGCTVNVDGATLLCPCHGSTYDRRGAVLRGPAERPLARFPAELRPDGVLEISLTPAAEGP